MADPTNDLDPLAGTARLAVVVPVAVLSFFYMVALEYSLPLYFDAHRYRDVSRYVPGLIQQILRDEDEETASAKFREEVLQRVSQGEDVTSADFTHVVTRRMLQGEEIAPFPPDIFPKDMWSEAVKYNVTLWIVGPLLAGLFARRYGERKVWSAALLGKVIVPVTLIAVPEPHLLKVLALWQGFTGALMWIAGISLIQMVRPEKKGLSNGLMMVSMGIGSVAGPIGGRLLIYRDEFAGIIRGGDWGEVGSRLFNLSKLQTTPQVVDFHTLFWLLTATTFLCGVLIVLWGQRPGRYQRDEAPNWNRTLGDLGELSRMPKFWALVLALCLIGGPVFQASNQFLPYRAEDLGLKSGSEDHGWIWLQLLKTLMWIPGGAAVGVLAGRRAPGFAAVLMLASFSLAAVGISASAAVWQLFCWVAMFEFVRQFMRWSHAGYLSEHLRDGLRATAIGFAISFSGLGSAIYAWVAPAVWDPKQPSFESWKPVLAAGIAGMIAAAALFAYNYFRPIRDDEQQITAHRNERRRE